MKLITNFYTLLAGSLLALAVLVAPTDAQLPANAAIYASGLQGPRGLAFGSDGAFYVSEAGTGGTVSTAGIEDIVVGLAVPTGRIFGPDHALYISNLGAAPAGAGQPLRVTLP